MYLFLDKLKETVLPRLREWHGFSPTSTRKPGTISLKLSEAALGYFPDIEAHFDMFPRLFDTDIDIITTATTDSEAVMMLSGFGLPFTERETVKRVKSDDDDPWAKFRRKSDKKRTSTNQKVAKK